MGWNFNQTGALTRSLKTKLSRLTPFPINFFRLQLINEMNAGHVTAGHVTAYVCRVSNSSQELVYLLYNCSYGMQLSCGSLQLE